MKAPLRQAPPLIEDLAELDPIEALERRKRRDEAFVELGHGVAPSLMQRKVGAARVAHEGV